MKYYTIANVTSECYGHGDYGSELRIVKHGGIGYGTGNFPPIFRTKSLAENWMKSQDFTGELRIVDLEVYGGV